MFDAEALAEEIARFDESDWIAHPTGMRGNSALPLVTVDGDPALGNSLQGPMRPTPALESCAYLGQVLASLRAVVGRVRLMRLSGRAEVNLHVDTDYYWNERVRVHVPIVTQPGVRFSCGDAQVNMAAGECWIFDTWRLHHVFNDVDVARIHLVVDTVGSAAFWSLVEAGRVHTAPRDTWRVQHVAANTRNALADIAFESVNSESPMSYWELRGHMLFVFGEVDARDPRVPPVGAKAKAFVAQWQTLWFRAGADAAQLTAYTALLDGFLADVVPAARGIPLRNGADMADCILGLLKRAVRRERPEPSSEETSRSAPVSSPQHLPLAASVDAFERPVFIVSPPRSGSTLLFETLSRSATAYTIGGESHALIEGIAELDTARNGYESNCLQRNDASPFVAQVLRERFRNRLFDRQLRKPSSGALRMLEKTPKNALRVPFLQAVFPDAIFVYLYRDPREVLSSMLEAWQSGRFVTYQQLPGWTGLPWSLLLTPGWRGLKGASLIDIVAQQWETTTRLLLDDLEKLPPEQVVVTRYEALLADSNGARARLCAAIDFEWDEPLAAPLPAARHTVSAPEPEKWRRHASEIEPALERVAGTAERARNFAQRR